MMRAKIREDLGVFTSRVFLCILLFGSYTVVSQEDECGTKFTDPASSTVRAQVVLEGEIMSKYQRPNSVGMDANVSVSTVYKGEDILNRRGMMGAENSVMITPFGEEDRDNCVASSIALPTGSKNVFFLRPTSQRGMLRLSAFPLPVQDEVERRVKRSLCDTCIKPPHIEEIACKDCAVVPTIKTMKTKKAKEGRRTRLRCQAKGNPVPTISWFRGASRITAEGLDGIRLQESRRASTLVFSRVDHSFAGEYQCIATNEVGQDIQVATLEVVPRRPRTTRRPRPLRRPRPTSPSSENRSQTMRPESRDTSTQLRICSNSLCSDGQHCFNISNENSSQCQCTDGSRCHFYQPNTPSSTLGSSISTNVLKTAGPHNNTQHHEKTSAAPETQTTDSTSGRIENSSHEESRSESNSPNNVNTPIITSSPQNGDATETSSSLASKLPTSHVNTVDDRHGTPSTKTVGFEKTTPSPQRPDFPATFDSLSNIGATSSPAKSRERTTELGPKTNRDSFVWLKTRRKKSRFCKDKKYCQNGGRCKIGRKSTVKFCECREGFAGNRCELVLS